MNKLLLILCSTFYLQISAQSFCGTKESSGPKTTKSINSSQKTSPASGFESHVIPIVIYIWNTPNITADVIQRQIDALNLAFDQVLEVDGHEVKFCLATTVNGISPIPTPFSPTIQNVFQYPNKGLFWIDDDEFTFPFGIHNSANNPTFSYFDNATGNINQDRYLRIYIGPIQGGLPAPSFSTITPPYKMKQHKLIALAPYHLIDNGIMPQHAEGDILIHEVGHYLGLEHIFNDHCNQTGPTYNCSTDGDYICDTPPMAMPDIDPNDCSFFSPEQCLGFSYPPTRNNYMDYVYDHCMTSFTPMQCNTMHDQLHNTGEHELLVSYHNQLYTSPDCSEVSGQGQSGAEWKITPTHHTANQDASIQVSPNPVTNTLNFVINTNKIETIQATITDITGKLITTSVLIHHGSKQSFSTNITHLKPGVYILNINNSIDYNESIRFVK